MSSEPSTPSRLERVLAYCSLAIIAAAVVSYFATLIVGMNDREALAHGLWQVVYSMSLFGLPAGFALLILLLVLSMRRRSAANRRALDAGGANRPGGRR